MGQLFFTDQNGRRWMCGWDNPSRGYYASRENDTDDPCAECQEDNCIDECQNFMNDWQEFDVLIGFGNGVKLTELDALCAVHGFNLTGTMIYELEADRARQEHPLTPLQKNMRAILEKCEWNVNPTLSPESIEHIRKAIIDGDTQSEWGKFTKKLIEDAVDREDLGGIR